MTFRCGDHVKHTPTGETWVVAYVDGEYMSWVGWPPGEARTADCVLVKACTDLEHVSLLHTIGRVERGDEDKRTRMARRALAEIEKVAANG